MGLGELSPWHLLILAAVVLVLFGAKKLPDSARSLGRAMRIFKAETQGLRGEGIDEDQPKAAAPPQQLPAAAPTAAPTAAPAAAPTAAPAAAPTATAPMQTRAEEGATVNGVPVPEAQRANQPH